MQHATHRARARPTKKICLLRRRWRPGDRGGAHATIGSAATARSTAVLRGLRAVDCRHGGWRTHKQRRRSHAAHCTFHRTQTARRGANSHNPHATRKPCASACSCSRPPRRSSARAHATRPVARSACCSALQLLEPCRVPSWRRPTNAPSHLDVDAPDLRLVGGTPLLERELSLPL